MNVRRCLIKGIKVAISGLIIVQSSVGTVSANHIVGGDVNMIYIADDRYRVQVNLYFDNVTGGLESISAFALVGVFSKRTNQQITTLSIQYRSGLFLPYTREECRVLSNSVTRHFYESEVVLPLGQYNDTAGYYMVYERCCRNGTATNIINSQNTGMVFYMEFPSLQQHRGYSSPQMVLPVTDPVCSGRLFQVSSRAPGLPSDSIVYDFVRPLAGNTSRIPPVPELPVPLPAPFAPVTWSSGLYTDQQPAPGTPPLSINPLTGLISFRPMQQGVFLYTVRMRHYRSGKKLGEVRRDFQLKVTGCPSDAPPEGRLYRLPERSLVTSLDTVVLKGDGSRCFLLRVADFSEPDRLSAYVALNPLQLPIRITPGEVSTSGIRDTVDFTICFPDCRLFPDTVIRIGVGFQDNACPKRNADTVYVWLRSSPLANTKPTLLLFPEVDTLRIKVGVTLPLTVVASDTADSDQNKVFLFGRRDNGSIRDLLPDWSDRSALGSVTQNVSLLADCALASPLPYRLRFFASDSSCFQEPPTQKSLFVFVEAADQGTVSFVLPNVVTPNGDGLNDFFTFEGSPTGTCEPYFTNVTISDRWGRNVFTSADAGFRWDPSSLPGGVYFAILTFEFKQYTTAITVIR